MKIDKKIAISTINVQTGSEVHPNSYPKGTGSSFPGVKVAGA
jgi:hypothetical protein